MDDILISAVSQLCIRDRGYIEKAFSTLVPKFNRGIRIPETYDTVSYTHLIDVNAKELEVLKCLLDNNGQVLTRMQIIDYVWKDSEEIPYDRVIDVYIKELRKKLQLDCITTIRNVGYKYSFLTKFSHTNRRL